MKSTETVDLYFQELEAKDEFSGVVLITRGETELYSGAFGHASRAWNIKKYIGYPFRYGFHYQVIFDFGYAATHRSKAA